jgi:hypothetical protein
MTKGRSSAALRAAGFVPLPRWWVTREQLELIAYMVKQNETEVNRIRSEASVLSPDEQIELAWRKHNSGQ